MVARQATRDTELAGVRIPAEQHVFIFVASANHDERRYDEPERFDISRPSIPHLAFGSGPHVCLGMHLTRVESHAALEQLLERFPDPAALTACGCTRSRSRRTDATFSLVVRDMESPRAAAATGGTIRAWRTR
jgi:cytochrome P450